jgi:hypothetical protein
MTAPNQAETPWSELRLDVLLITAGIASPIVFYLVDRHAGCHDLFSRSGALTAFAGAWLAYRSLARHYLKFFRNTGRGYALLTSAKQKLVDRLTFGITGAGTLVWAYGDKLFQRACS